MVKLPLISQITMRFNRMVDTFLYLGYRPTDSKTERKRIKLLNIFCFVWHVLTILTFIEDYFVEGNDVLVTLTVCGVMLLLVGTVQMLQKARKPIPARMLFVASIILLTFVFSNFTYPSQLLEYYFLFPPAISLIFIDTKALNYSVLGVSYACLFFPNLYFEHYPIPIFNDMNVSFLFFGIFVMVSFFKSQNKKNEKALESKTDELKELNAFQSQFFINISHELKTPLTLIKGQIGQLSPESKNHIQRIKKLANKQIDTMTYMINEVLNLAKMESSDFVMSTRTVNFSQLINNLYLAYTPLFKEKKVDFELERIPKDYFVDGDPMYLDKAIGNIILNALKYTDSGGTVILKLIRKINLVQLNIKDTGEGIALKEQQLIFKRFYRVKNTVNMAGGTGIGLAFSKEIMERHKGAVSVRSRLGQGSNFRIKLPLKKSITPLNQRTRVIRPPSDTPKNGAVKISLDGHILLVEDHLEMREYLKNLLGLAHCMEAANGREALRKLEKKLPELIITDYMMPEMNGPEFIKALRSKGYDVPILMLTARGDKQSKLEALRLGIDDYLSKPFEQEELILRTQNLLSNYRSRKQFQKKTNSQPNDDFNCEPLLRQITTYVLERCSDPDLKQEDIGAHLGLSKSSLYRKIKGYTGMSPNTFITDIKLHKARRLLEDDPDLSLKQLSHELGFLHRSYFSKIYFEKFGQKPWRLGSTSTKIIS